MNNRIIKFRVWDTETMYYHGDHVPMEGCDCYFVGIYNGNALVQERCEDDGNYMLIRVSDMDELEIMQYTGLKDTNGTEIYEGDIIQYANGLCGAVKWLNEQDNFDFTGWVTSYRNENCTGDGNIVIGNIYENPDLLK